MKRFFSMVLSISILLGSINVPALAAEVHTVEISYKDGLVPEEDLEKREDDDDVVPFVQKTSENEDEEFDEVIIRSWNLKRGIINQNGVQVTPEIVDNTDVTKRMIRKMVYLSPEQCGAHDLNEWQIKVNSLEGLQYAENLEWLSLVYQEVNDITPLENLTKLKHLDLRDAQYKGEPIRDLEPLSKLVNLERLDIQAARPESTEPLKNLVNLRHLKIDSTKLQNLDFLENMDKLGFLSSKHNPIKSIEPLRGLNNLEVVIVSGPTIRFGFDDERGEIKDLTPIGNSLKIRELDISNHMVKDISILKNLTNLNSFIATNNEIEDFEVLLTLPNLDIVWIEGNPGYKGYGDASGDYKQAKGIFDSLNKKNLTKADLGTLEKLENTDEAVKSFFKDSTLDTLATYKAELADKDSIENNAFDMDYQVENPDLPEPEETQKDIVEVMGLDSIEIKKGDSIEGKLPNKVKVKLGSVKEDVLTRDDEPKIGTFRRNFKNGEEFGATSIAYKVIDQNGKLISSKEYPKLLSGISDDENMDTIYFKSVGDYYEYETTGDRYFYNINVLSDKYEIEGIYGFQQEECPTFKAGTVRDVKANDRSINRHEANKELNEFHVIKVKEIIKDDKEEIENPALGIDTTSRDNTITYKVVDTNGEVLSAKEFPGIIIARNAIPEYTQKAESVGDYYRFKSNGETTNFDIEIKSDDYELVGKYRFDTDYNVDSMGGKFTSVENTSLANKTYYRIPQDKPGEEVFVITVKAKGEADPEVNSKLDKLLAELKDFVNKTNKFIEDNEFTEEGNSSLAKLKETLVKAEKELENTLATSDSVEIILKDLKEDKSSLEKYLEKEEPVGDRVKVGLEDDNTVIRYKIVDEDGILVSPDDLTVKYTIFDYLESDGNTVKYQANGQNGKCDIFIESEKYEMVSENSFYKSFSFSGTKITKVYLNEEEIIIEDESEIEDKYFTIVVKEKDDNSTIEEPEQSETRKVDYVEGSQAGISKSKDGHENITFKLVDEKNRPVKASEYPELLKTRSTQGGQENLEAKVNEDNYTFATGSGVGDEYVIELIDNEDYILNGEYKFSTKYGPNWKDIIDTIINSNNSDKTYFKVGTDELTEDVFTIKVKTKEENVNAVSGSLESFSDLDSETIVDLPVKWDLTTFKNEKGSYTVYGDLLLADNINNPKELRAEITVIVVEDEAENPGETPGETPNDKIKVERTAGDNRYLTAIEISAKQFDKADTVILANGEDFPDSLSAAPLTSIKNAPLLLTSEGKNLELVKEEIQRLGAKNIIIVGGETSVSKAQEDFYSKLGKVERIAGKNRFETSLEIAKVVLANNPKQDKLIVVQGFKYADALAIGSYSAKEQMPILLSNGSDISYAKDLLSEKSIDKALIVGGKESIKAGVEAEFTNAHRIEGANRYETARKIAEELFPQAEKIALVSGENFPDALALSSLAGKESLPIVLTSKNKLDENVEKYIKENIKEVQIFGGVNSIAEGIIK